MLEPHAERVGSTPATTTWLLPGIMITEKVMSRRREVHIHLLLRFFLMKLMLSLFKLKWTSLLSTASLQLPIPQQVVK
jgi:hypothetical protein